MTTLKIIRLARQHVANDAATESSARLCLSDALACYDAGDLESAVQRAIKSLAYSIGVFHRDYQRTVK